MKRDQAEKLLKPCPFCGLEAKLTPKDTVYVAGCQNEACGIQPSHMIAPPEFGVFSQQWNQRSGDDALKSQITTKL